MDIVHDTPKDLADLVLSKLDLLKSSYVKPNIETLVKLFEILFYTSLKTEEGEFIAVTITLIDPINPDPNPPSTIRPHRWNFIKFDSQIQLDVKSLVKLSKAADTWSSSLAVYYDDENNLFIWGMIDQAIHSQNYLNHETEYINEQPGLFQATISGIGNIMVLMDYQLMAHLKQNAITKTYLDVFKRGNVSQKIKAFTYKYKENIKESLNEKFDVFVTDDWDGYVENEIINSLMRILLRIQNYGHGGAILITDSYTEELSIKYKIDYSRFKDALLNVIKYTIEYDAYSDLIFDDYVNEELSDIPAETYLGEIKARENKNDTANELRGAIRFISSLSRVDGLVIFDEELVVRGFGSVIRENQPPKFVYVAKSSIISEANLTKLNSSHFGTRHQSMFSFCWKNEKSVGFVISQDGDVRAIARVGKRLILWENIRLQKFTRSKKLKKIEN